MIEVEGLCKYFGDFVAIEDVSFRVNRGEVLGFLGPNGAGKTTTMKILTGFMSPSAGTARIANYDVQMQSLEARAHIGYMPETVPLYTDMTVRNYLQFQGALRGMDSKRLQKRISEVIDICRLGDYRDTLIGKLSKGYRQRVGVAQAILHEPDVLILDEPTIGIDPRQVVETRQMIKQLGGRHTVLISSHVLPEVSQVCERVVIINEGRVVAEDKPENLSVRLRGADRVQVDARGPVEQIAGKFRQVKGVKEVTIAIPGERPRLFVDCDPKVDCRADLAKVVVNNRWELLGLQSAGMSLEEIFLRLTSEEEG